MIVLAGGDIVLPDRILTNASLVIDRGRIAAVETTRSLPSGASIVDVTICRPPASLRVSVWRDDSTPPTR